MLRLALASGGLVFVGLGLLHGYLTALAMRSSGALMPADHSVSRLMMGAVTRVDRDMSLWNAWIGFNWSHSLGLVLFGAVVVLFAERLHPAYLAGLIPGIAFVVVSGCYVLLAVRFWFSAPAIGTGLGTALLVLALLLRVMR